MMSISASRSNAQTNTVKIFYPPSTVRCDGPVLFRDQLARDVACILDVDDDVVSWSCQSFGLTYDGYLFRPDFYVHRVDSTVLLDAAREEGAPDWVWDQADKAGLTYQIVKLSELPPIRLKNARDLMRYARYEAALSDRVRLLATLDECSSLTVAEALVVFRETAPMAGLASMILHRFVTIDLDEGLIGPESVIRRRRD
jgi:hypothetical protein